MSEAATGGIPEKLAALGPNHTTAEAFHAIDTDQSGQISLAEFAPVYEHGREQARAQERTTNKALAENKLLKWMVVLLIGAVLIIIGITSGVTAVVVNDSKESHVKGNTLVSAVDGSVVATAQRLAKIPLMALGNLEFAKLGSLNTVAMWADMGGKWVQMVVTVSMAYKDSAHEVTITSASGAIVHVDSKAKTGTIKLGADAKPLDIANTDPSVASRRRLQDEHDVCTFGAANQCEGKCVAETQGPDQGATDEACEKCPEYEWWPCNQKKLCVCTGSSGSSEPTGGMVVVANNDVLPFGQSTFDTTQVDPVPNDKALIVGPVVLSLERNEFDEQAYKETIAQLANVDADDVQLTVTSGSESRRLAITDGLISVTAIVKAGSGAEAERMLATIKETDLEAALSAALECGNCVESVGTLSVSRSTSLPPATSTVCWSRIANLLANGEGCALLADPARGLGPNSHRVWTLMQEEAKERTADALEYCGCTVTDANRQELGGVMMEFGASCTFKTPLHEAGEGDTSKLEAELQSCRAKLNSGICAPFAPPSAPPPPPSPLRPASAPYICSVFAKEGSSTECSGKTPPSDETPPNDKAELQSRLEEYCTDQDAAEGLYGPVSCWDVSRIKDMSNLWTPTMGSCNPVGLGLWDTSDVTSMENMFKGASGFNQALTNFRTCEVTSMRGMFSGAAVFNQDISSFRTAKVTNMQEMFRDTSAFKQPLDNFDTSKVTNMRWMFRDARAFNQPLDNFDTAEVTNMQGMFWNAQAFNKQLDNFDTSMVNDMRDMFRSASAFNQPLDKFDTSKVTSMEAMFYFAIAFNQPLDKFDTSKVTNMQWMFRDARAFNHPLDKFDTSKVTNMWWMFYGATAFNQPLDKFDTSKVTNMEGMFGGATAFNQRLDKFDTSKVTSMQTMFYFATAFNHPLDNFDTSKVTNMWLMFGETAFNQPLDKFDLSQVTNAKQAFKSTGSTTRNSIRAPDGGKWDECPGKTADDFWGKYPCARNTCEDREQCNPAESASIFYCYLSC